MKGKTRMNTVDDFMNEANNLTTHYNDGLIHKAEFISTCKFHLNKLALDDMEKAKRIVEQYGYDGNSFSTWMHEQAGKK